MPRNVSADPYAWLAEYYDELFDFRAPFVTARQRVLAPILPGVKSACDIACGTGTTAIELAGEGIQVTGLDVSAAMCRVARRKVKAANLDIRIRRADMRDFTLPAPVDLILCELDALNHVPEKSDLFRVASAAARALRPGGHFFFDVNNRPCLKHLWPVTNWIDTPRAAVAVHGGYDPETETAWNDVEGFLRDGKHWRRRHARIEELCWSAAEIRSALTDAGFDRIRARDASSLMRGLLIIRRGYRSVYLARKPTSA